MDVFPSASSTDWTGHSQSQPRASSRSSTSTTSATSTSATRTTPQSAQSAHSSSSYLPGSPPIALASPATRRLHPYSSALSAPRPLPVPPMSRSLTVDARQGPVLSGYLHERLQRERADSDKTTTVTGNVPPSPSRTTLSTLSDHASIAESKPSRSGRAVQSSPVRPDALPSDGRRPQSSGEQDAAKRKGVGAKEMEKAVSTLHKQNFDLKLELFHRREKQTTLEERLDKVDNDKTKLDETNNRLVQQLDQKDQQLADKDHQLALKDRELAQKDDQLAQKDKELENCDKAVEEAVAMIVLLEAQVERLLKEREMVREIETADYPPPSDPVTVTHITTTTTRSHSPPRSSHPGRPSGVGPGAGSGRVSVTPSAADEVRSLHRMPSFLSDQSENTDYLRNVYLGVRGSLISLPHFPDGAMSDQAASLVSPSLSVLSESSFVSVYGNRHGRRRLSDNNQNGNDNQHGIDEDDDDNEDGLSHLAGERGLLHDVYPSTMLTRLPSRAASARIGSRELVDAQHYLLGFSRTARSNSASRASSVALAPAPFPSINHVIDQSSPLQRLERKMDQNRNRSLRETSLSSSSRLVKTVPVPAPLSIPRPTESDGLWSGSAVRSAASRSKEEKRAALRRVLTTTPAPTPSPAHAPSSASLSAVNSATTSAGVGLRTHLDHVLPPTPATISTSTLRHYKNSDETQADRDLIKPAALKDGRRAIAARDRDKHDGGRGTNRRDEEKERGDGDAAEYKHDREHKHARKHEERGELAGRLSDSAYDSLPRPFSSKGTSGWDYIDSGIPIAPRPRSADEDAVSVSRWQRRRQSSRWDFDDSDAESGAYSLESSLDIWLRDGGRTASTTDRHTATAATPTTIATARLTRPRSCTRTRTRRLSPDLFSFPTDPVRGGWDTSASLFGTSAPQPHASSSSSRLGLGLGLVDDDLLSMHQALFTHHQSGPPPTPNRRSSLHAHTGTSLKAASRPTSGVVVAAADASPSPRAEPPPQAHAQLVESKKAHPPPSQPPRSRGLNSLFRRSLGAGGGGATSTGAPSQAQDDGSSSGPTTAWHGHAITPSKTSHQPEPARRSATPPPIQRSRGPAEPEPAPDVPPHSAAAGGSVRRRWLPGFARSNSLKTRIG